MELLFPAIAVVLATLFLLGWVLLFLSLLVTASSVTAGGIVLAGSLVSGLAPARAAESASGILSIDGLPARHARRLRRQLARVLRLAPSETAPRACACVKAVDGRFVGVLRVFNRKGHFLLRAPGLSAAAVARTLSVALAGFRDGFPAVAGIPREACPECDPRTCPLRQLGRRPAVALKPA
ncbi:MAG: hypothetical protein ACYTG2_09995 [Planctomycetota bacterium]|jgi:hypothetical protein